MSVPAARFAALAAVLLALPLTASAQAGPRPVAGASVVVIIPDSLGAAPRTLSELLRDYVPAASVQRSTGAMGAGAWLSLRDASAVRGDDPLVVIDGIRQASYRTRLDTLSRRAPSVLDDIMLEDVARVEVLNGPAAAANYGYEGQHGAIIVTTRAVGQGRPELRASITTSAADNPDYPRNLSRVTATGTACPYFYEALGGCTATSTTRYTPLLDRSPFRAAQQARVNLGATGGLGLLGYAASLGFERGTGTMDANASDRTTGSLRMNAPITRAFRVGLAVFATERGLTTPVDGASSLIAQGIGGGPIDCSSTTPCGADSASGGYRAGPLTWVQQQRGPRRRIDHLGQAVTIEVEPSSRLSLRTNVSADLLRDRVGNLDSTQFRSTPLALSYDRARAKERNWRVGGSQEVRLTTNIGPAVGTTTLSARFESERSRDDRSEEHYVSPSTPFPGGVYATASAAAWLRRERREIGLDQRFTLGDRASVGVGAIRTTTNLWKTFDHLSAVTDPHADAMFQLVPESAPLGVLASLRLRTAYAEASGYDARFYADVRGLGVLPPPYIFGGNLPPGPPRHQPDRTAELEAGFDATFSPGSSRLSVTAFRKRETVRLFFPMVIATNSIDAALKRRVAGAELVAEATPVDLPGARLRLRGQFAWTHDRVTDFPLDVLYFAGNADIGLSAANGQSWAAWRAPGFTWNDANGNGRIEGSELKPGNYMGAGGRSRPSRAGSLASTLDFAHSFEFTALADHVGGFDVYDMTSALQCARLVCPALNDPKASLSEQARAVAVAERFSSAGFLVPGDAIRLRELSLSYRSRRAATAVRASSLRVTLSAYDLASWTRSKGVHPETDMPAPGDRENVLWSAVQPIPRTVGLRVALVY